jgi:hypothetical protein
VYCTPVLRYERGALLPLDARARSVRCSTTSTHTDGFDHLAHATSASIRWSSCRTAQAPKVNCTSVCSSYVVVEPLRWSVSRSFSRQSKIPFSSPPRTYTMPHPTVKGRETNYSRCSAVSVQVSEERKIPLTPFAFFASLFFWRCPC